MRTRKVDSKRSYRGTLLAAYLSLLALSLLGACPPGGPTNPGPSTNCTACIDSSCPGGDPQCAQAKCAFVCGSESPQSADKCTGCKQECGSNTQCYQTNCAALCPALQTCQSCTQDHCNGAPDQAACVKEKCSDACTPPAIDAGVP